MRILVACEKSQAVCIAFRKRGHEAHSCDLQECSGGHPEWHYKMDVFVAYYKYGPWDLVISFQPCTDLAVSGAKHFYYKRDNGSQEKSIRFFFEVWKISDCSENPIGIINGGKYLKQWFPQLFKEMQIAGFPFKPDQIIQPWQFGHGEVKATCLWLRRGLLKLKPTKIVKGREPVVWRMGPSIDRAEKRSATKPGLARAMAAQWSEDLTKTK